MKKRVLPILLSASLVCGLSFGALSAQAAPTEVFRDDFSGAALSGDYVATDGVNKVVDGNLVMDTTAIAENAFGGVTLSKQKVTEFVLEFDLHNECAGNNTFGIVTGMADAAVPTNEAYLASGIAFGTVDSMSVHNAAGQWQRYSWEKVPADARVRVTVTADTFAIEYKVGGGEWTAIVDHSSGKVKLAPAEGYVGLVVNGQGKVAVDNVSLLTESEENVPDTKPDEGIAGDNYVWSDDFERAELGDRYISTAKSGIKLENGRLHFTNTVADAEGLFFNTKKLGNRFAISFDINMQEGSACPALLVGIDMQNPPIMYWDSSADRISLYMEKYMIGRGEKQLDNEANRGTDADVIPSAVASLQPHCTAYMKDAEEYLNVCLVFDEEDGENVLRVYYKLNTDPDKDMNMLRSVWKGVDPAGYIGLVAQGHLSADFWVDNLKVTTVLPEIIEPDPENPEKPDPVNPDNSTPDTPDVSEQKNPNSADTIPGTGETPVAAAAVAAAALGGAAVIYLKKKK